MVQLKEAIGSDLNAEGETRNPTHAFAVALELYFGLVTKALTTTPKATFRKYFIIRVNTM